MLVSNRAMTGVSDSFDAAFFSYCDGLNDEAEQAFREIHQRAPEHVATFIHLGALALCRNQSKEAWAYYYKLLSRSDETVLDAIRTTPWPKTALNLEIDLVVFAGAALTSRRLGLAEALFEEVLSRFPNNPDAHNNLGLIRLDDDDDRLDDAIGHFRAATKLKPDWGRAWSTLAKALTRKGRMSDSEMRWSGRSRSNPTTGRFVATWRLS